jgi:hypothetical protein
MGVARKARIMADQLRRRAHHIHGVMASHGHLKDGVGALTSEVVVKIILPVVSVEMLSDYGCSYHAVDSPDYPFPFFFFGVSLLIEIVLEANSVSLVLRNGDILIAKRHDTLVEVDNETLAGVCVCPPLSVCTVPTQASVIFSVA